MEDLHNDYQGELSGLPHDDRPGGPKNVKPFLEDDIVPDLPSDWKPLSFSTEDVQSEAMNLNDEVSLM
jgi:hypothetical protein